MRNKLSDLNNHLFAEIERLGEDELEGEALDREVKRAKAIGDVASTIISNANVMLAAARFRDGASDGGARRELPEAMR